MIPRVLVRRDGGLDEILHFLAFRVVTDHAASQDDEGTDDTSPLGSATPITAFSTTSRCRSMAASTSGAPTLYPEETIMSSDRAWYQKYPSSSLVKVSPVTFQPLHTYRC